MQHEIQHRIAARQRTFATGAHRLGQGSLPLHLGHDIGLQRTQQRPEDGDFRRVICQMQRPVWVEFMVGTIIGDDGQ